MKLLITGGAGFIGSNFIRHILDKYNDYIVVNLDALTYAGNLNNLNDIEDNPRYTFAKGDINDSVLVDKLIKEHSIEVIINFAAESHVDNSILDSRVFIDTNIAGTETLLRQALNHHVRFFQISTDEVYGSLGKTGLFTETTNLAPNSPYSASKASADMLVRSYNKTYNLHTVITRASNNYGPYQFTEKLIPLMINNAHHDKSLPVYGDGKNVRDWLHVTDHCNGIDTVLHNGVSGEIYNIGGGNEVENIDIVKRILKKLKKPKTLITYVEDRLGHDRRYAVDISKIKNELGWEPAYRFENGIENTVEWYLANKDWWDAA